MNQHTTPRAMRLFSVVALSGVLLLAGCGDDDEEAKGDTATTAAAAAAAEDASVQSACDAYTDISKAMSEMPEGDPAVYLKGTVMPLVEELDANKPAEVEAEVDTMVAAATKAGESGDMSAFESPEFGKAQGKVDPYMFNNCDFDNKIEVSGKEYAFEGMGDTMPTGKTAILFTNDGMESHEIIVASKKDGVTESFDELLAMPEEKAMEKINMLGAAFAPAKGDQALLVADFEPGDYAALCCIPTGTMMHDGEETPGDGPPHFVQGMKSEFTVT